MKRFILAIKVFFRILFGKPLPPELVTPPKAALPPAPDGAVQLLTILQREGRLVDFLEEDIASYADAQIGAAVRDIHRGCRKVLAEYFVIEPVLPGVENATVSIPTGFDAAEIRLTGNVVGQPPYRGALRHHGWRTTKVQLPNLPPIEKPAVLAPAEVELS